MRKPVRQDERNSHLTGNTAYNIEGIRTAFNVEGIRQRIGSGFRMLTHRDRKKAIAVP